MEGSIRHPGIKVRLVGQNANGLSIVGRVVREMHRAMLPNGEVDAYVKGALSGTYDHLLATTCQRVCVS
jgi:hypothetical protein